MRSGNRFSARTWRGFAIGSIALSATMLSLLMYAPDASACWPYVVGDAQCPSGDPVEGVSVRIDRGESTGFPPCDPATYYDTTDEFGHFDTCIFCGYVWVDITIEGETRTQYVTGYTDFGTWIVEPDADSDGWSPCNGDCDDNNPAVYPGHREVCGNGIDDDCDGLVDEGCSSGSPIFRKPDIQVQPPEEP